MSDVLTLTGPPAAVPTSAEHFCAYVAARYPSLVRSSYLITGSRADAEDLVQSALAKTWLALPRLREPRALDAYVRRTLVNTQRSTWRRHRVQELPTEELPEPREAASVPPGALRHDEIWAALLRLPRQQRAALVLRYYEERSEAETAELLGVTVGTVKSTTSRALSRLRQDLAEPQ